MKSEFQVLVDSDAFVGRFFPKDAHHKKTTLIFAKLERQDTTLTTTSMVIAETATVLSHYSGQGLASRFLDIIRRSKLPTIHITERLQQDAYALFGRQEKKGTSMVDCANVMVMQRFHIPEIFSFDRFYFAKFGLKSPIMSLLEA